jgi:hypothetical protein
MCRREPSGGGTNGVGLAPGATTQPQNMAARDLMTPTLCTCADAKCAGTAHGL